MERLIPTDRNYRELYNIFMLVFIRFIWLAYLVLNELFKTLIIDVESRTVWLDWVATESKWYNTKESESWVSFRLGPT